MKIGAVKIVISVFFALAAAGAYAVETEHIAGELVIEATKPSLSTVVIHSEPFYQKSFELLVENRGKEPVELTGWTGCYKAFDEKGNEFNEHTVQVDLLGKLPKNKVFAGRVSFVAKDDSVYKAQFVKWSSQCKKTGK